MGADEPASTIRTAAAGAATIERRVACDGIECGAPRGSASALRMHHLRSKHFSSAAPIVLNVGRTIAVILDILVVAQSLRRLRQAIADQRPGGRHELVQSVHRTLPP
jgi:hypothetical protein